MTKTVKYHPVKPDPTMDDCLRAFRFSDYMQWAGVSVASWGFGFAVGKPARFGVAGLMSAIGFTFGSMVALQNSRGRLMGFRENTRELKKFGSPEGSEQLTPGSSLRPPLDFTKYN